nr:pyruvate formate lyase family protein [Clostridia bacterium]
MITTKYTEIYEAEMRGYFSALPADIAALKEQALAAMEAAPSPYQKKSAVHRVMAENSPVHLFRGYPLYFEFDSGRNRYDWGLSSRLGRLMIESGIAEWYRHEGGYNDEVKPYIEKSMFSGWSPVGLDHHALNYERIVDEGYQSIRERILAEIEKAEGEKAKRGLPFLYAALESCEAMMTLAHRFSEEAKCRAESETVPEFKADFEAIADIAARIPAQPCKTFRDALSAVIFSRETTGSFEAYGVSTYGHLDRILGKYLEADLASGRITRGEAKRLLHALLAYTELRFDKDTIEKGQLHETSTTVYIGGCGRDGEPIFNELTRLILEVYTEGGYFGTKLIARISSRHPSEFSALLGDFISGGFNTIVIQNDEVLIDAHTRQGKAPEDSRLYVGGGCHEVLLGGYEVHSRADSWVNLPQIMMQTMKENTFDDYISFYMAVIADFRKFHDTVSSIKNKYEKLWWKYNPAPMLSCVTEDCISKRKDITEGGARYNSVSLSMSGAATVIDSIWAVKEAVWGDEAFISYDELVKAVEADFEGNEDLRQRLLKYPKFGGANRIDPEFADSVLRDIAACAGQPNARGGHFVPAFYPHGVYRDFGRNMGATPDGRKA